MLHFACHLTCAGNAKSFFLLPSFFPFKAFLPQRTLFLLSTKTLFASNCFLRNFSFLILIGIRAIAFGISEQFQMELAGKPEPLGAIVIKSCYKPLKAFTGPCHWGYLSQLPGGTNVSGQILQLPVKRFNHDTLCSSKKR